jgi:septum site-determining protein MinC
MTEVLTDAPSIRIKGRSFLAVVLSPAQPVERWLEGLDDLAARSAGFFLERPVVLDVTDLAIERPALKGLIVELSKRNVRVMGIEGGRASLFEPGMPPQMKGGRPAADFEVAATEPATERAKAPAEQATQPIVDVLETTVAAEPQATTKSLIIREPVRSGQSVIFPEGDVTIVGSVASGAEIVAGGSIHIYGTLRGRALAGTMGNASARIFCRKLEAELLAIDGIYTTAEELPSDLVGHAVQLWLEGDAIQVQKLI